MTFSAVRSEAKGKKAKAKTKTESIKPAASADVPSGKAYQQYLDFFEEVFQKFQENYYKKISRLNYDRFIKTFNEQIYANLPVKDEVDDYIRWRSSATLVKYLKDKEDIFSDFYPPKPAKEYEGEALAKTIEVEKRIDLGVSGRLIEQGFVVEYLEPRSDAYEKGLRENDLIVDIDGTDVREVDEEQMALLLRPFVTATATIRYVAASDRQPKEIEVKPKEFFKQEVFPIATKIPGIYGLEIRRFNRKTGADFFRYMQFFQQQGDIKGLIIDLRGNPGGPPLAALELSSMFLPGGDEFAYFLKEGESKKELEVPAIPEQYKYDGPIVILVNEKSGSASELFSGVMQRRGRAVLMGKNTAGQVMLKSMFHFDDESMLLLVTARGHHPDGQVFSFGGVVPDLKVEEGEDVDLVREAQLYFVYLEKKEAEKP